MRALDLLKLPLHALALAGKTKSFVANPLIGSHWLNERGLHRQRVDLADRSAWARRRQLGKVLAAEERDAYARDGFVVKRDFLPAELFARLQAEAPAHVAAAREMRQGPAVTRRVALDSVDAANLPACVAAANDPRIDQLMRYVGAHDAVPLLYLQTIIVDPARGNQDPQTVLHRDTFHAIAKAWLFLQDVGEDDGPFSYVPGSHRLTDAMRAWEYEESLKAAHSENVYHARGSFRMPPEDLGRLGLGPALKVVVPANTLVVADTHGFHARTPSLRPTLRMEIYGTLRGNPYGLGFGLDPLAWPGIRSRRTNLVDQAEELAGRLKLGGKGWPVVSARRMDSPEIG
ncbi:MAG: phytanoyl-CoA dioxygenase family protein [Candidatus Accumulibacter phosphatis]|jgi:hypothetical protein|uniref:phytanoyl-CoA dioxygenase family protein n=1 Tax=Candidatus Accumulibacter sp. ACC012 TaxID=2823332 RepID=UPI0025C2C4A3|nr:phytanoyl-CoA dioxygenase family protein [Candidatus Accumulibacter sp. ACC012]